MAKARGSAPVVHAAHSDSLFTPGCAMDLSHLTRPGILCQCSRCSSSLAALENEWAKLSNAYSIPTAWLSVDLHRISVSSERKQIPNTSDMTLLRGRVIQEVSCKLCQQRMGVLCPLDNGMNILWKMSKVAFREIVTMRTVQPLFKQGALERLICPPKEPLRRDSDLLQDSALVPAGCTDPASLDPSMQKQMLHQGRSIDQISNSVNHLQDTMSDLKHSFTALRIELNGPSRNMGEGSRLQGHDFDMIATVLKELKSKSEEIEKLKLEIEALKLKNRYMGVAPPPPPQQDSLSVMNMNAALPEVRSPGLLQAGRKRTWPDAFPIDRQQAIADSFDEDDMVDDFALSDPAVPPARIPLNDQSSQSIPNGHTTEYEAGSMGSQAASENPQNFLISVPTRPETPPQPIAKRPRLSQQPENGTQAAAAEPAAIQRKAGRPRKSISQPNKPDTIQSPNTAPPTTQDDAESNPPAGTLRRRRSRRSLREPSPGPIPTDHDGSEITQQPPNPTNATGTQSAPNKKSKRNPSSPKGNIADGPDHSADEAAMNEKRKAKVAARDVMAKMALQHEEALEAGNTR
ncbi:unnamed protein product [Penicillium salamii]|uniref:Mis18 domain-containing protein n=1 Tax=Penicillium salamii TaxID=1612424 RepID=A0A9W4IEA8_9EURO|nr:unnamed protein product [Penicillium salamii]CAG7965119.1 unnamed protein product [Penicillium salamii]CAG7986278.1 unnamed protein product [Penicillium salamii]CAG8134567.1 unnamed protein product [Penicillium salamii]CAG8191198.1 unnamed protein product [Penicillium salamii]